MKHKIAEVSVNAIGATVTKVVVNMGKENIKEGMVDKK